jgi:hypothetical protein
MMDIETFQRSLSQAAPPAKLGLALEALWWAGKGDWERAHGCAQLQEGEPGCDWVHAHLHRQEGDLANARYWYRRAGRPVPDIALPAEWMAIATQLLTAPAALRRRLP